MKCIVIIILAIFLAQAHSQQRMSTTEAGRLVREIEKQNIGGIGNSVDQEYTQTSADFLSLKALVLANWTETIDQWEVITNGKDYCGEFVFLALEELPVWDYMNMLEKIADLPKESKTFKSVSPLILFPFGRMNGFFGI